MRASAALSDAKLGTKHPDPTSRGRAQMGTAAAVSPRRLFSAAMSPADAVAMLAETSGEGAAASRRAILGRIQQVYGNQYASVVVAELRAREAQKTGKAPTEPLEPEKAQPPEAAAAAPALIAGKAAAMASAAGQPSPAPSISRAVTLALAAAASTLALPDAKAPAAVTAARKDETESPVSASEATVPARPGETVARGNPVQLVQRRLANQGIAALISRDAASHEAPNAAISNADSVGAAPTSLKVSSPHDPAEREATAVAAFVMRGATPGAIQRDVPKAAADIQRAADTHGGATREAGAAAPSASAEIARSMSGGAPLPGSVRGFMEPRFGTSFRNVRIHTGENAAGLSAQLSAKAFTVGNHVFFGRNQYRPENPEGQELIAHELTHTVQQGAAVQRQADQGGSLFPDLSAEGLVTAGIREVAPSLEPMVRRGGGLVEWLKDRATSAVEGMFTTLMAPVHSIAGVGQQLSAQFAPMLETVQVAAAQIAKNDCTPLRDAADKLEKIAERLITPIVEKLQPVVATVKNFLNGIWEKFGSPIWEWIKQYAAAQWETIKGIADILQRAATWLWDRSAGIRAVYAEAWSWLMNKLGIGDGVEGQAGILQWIEGKLDAAWSAIKVKLEPFKNELTAIGSAVAGVVLALSPVGPIMAIGTGVAQGLKWIHANWGKGNMIVQARVYIAGTLIPPLVGAARNLSAAVVGMANSISAALGSLAAAMARAVGTLGGSLLGFAVSAVQWIADQVTALATWASAQLGQLGAWLNGALNGLEEFLGGVLEFLRRVGDVILDVWGLPVLLAEKIWNWVPACIRDPVVDYLGPLILRQIEFFQELAKDSEAWQKTKAEVGGIIRLVFHNHDLMGAVRATFHLILRIFNVPAALVVTVVQKAERAWDVVIKKPLEFIKNTVRALGLGFKRIWDDKIENLKLGLGGWLVGEVKERNIAIPTKWGEPRQLFEFVLSVLGLSIDHVYELLKKRFPGPAIEKIRSAIGKVAGVLSWVDHAVDTTKSPRENALGMVNQAKEFGKSILTGIAEWVAAKVAEEVAIMTAAAAASAGLSEIADIARRIYKVMVAAAQYARPILDMMDEALDHVTDLALGAVGKVGVLFEGLMKRAMPVVIGFLAYQVGLGGVGAAIRGIIDALRQTVDAAILWVIDRIKGGLEWLVGTAKAGVELVTEWWKGSVAFSDRRGNQHKIFYSGSGAGARLKIASTEVFTEEFITRMEKIFSTNPSAREYGQHKLQSCRNSLRTLEHLKSQLELATRTKSPSLEQFQKEHKEEMVRLSAFVALLMDIPPETSAAPGGWPPGVIVGANLWVPEQGGSLAQVLDITPDRIFYRVVEGGHGTVVTPRDKFTELWQQRLILPGATVESAEQRRRRLIAIHGVEIGTVVDDAIKRRGDLASNLKIFNPLQAHHVIPVELLTKVERLRLLIYELGWDFNAVINGEPLAAGFHGTHPVYTAYVHKKIESWEITHKKQPISEFKKWVEETLIELTLRPAIHIAQASGKTLNEHFAAMLKSGK